MPGRIFGSDRDGERLIGCARTRLMGDHVMVGSGSSELPDRTWHSAGTFGDYTPVVGGVGSEIADVPEGDGRCSNELGAAKVRGGAEVNFVTRGKPVAWASPGKIKVNVSSGGK